MKKTVYVALSVDFIHSGHIRVLNKAARLGNIIIGLLTDEAISTYKRIPYLNYEQRKSVVGNMKGVISVIPQYTLEYTDNLIKYKPDYVVHGDDWKTGVQKEVREKVLSTIREWKGELIEVPYTEGLSARLINEAAF